MQKKEVRKLFSLPSVHWSLVLTCARTQFEIPDHISSSPKLHLLNLNNGSHLFILPAILYFSQPPTRSQLPRSSIVLDWYYMNSHYRGGNRLFSTKILFIICQLWTTSLSWLARAVFSAFQLGAFWIVKQLARLIFITDILRALCDVQIQ